MFRLRLLRVLLPLLLVFLAFLLWSSWNPRPPVHRSKEAAPARTEPHVEGLEGIEVVGSDAAFEVQSRVVESKDDGSLHLEGIRELTIQREGRGPLTIEADRGDRVGPVGGYQWHFQDRVVFREPEEGLRLELPVLDIDEAEGWARSVGDIRFFAPRLEGGASELTYGLEGQPGKLAAPWFQDAEGATVTARHGTLLDGIRDVELFDDVKITRPGSELTTDRLRLLRGPDNRLQLAVGSGRVRGHCTTGGGEDARLRGDRVELRWAPDGEIDFVAVEGDSLLSRGRQTLSAATIEAARNRSGAAGWKVEATREVLVEGSFGAAPGRLRAEQLRATLDASFLVREAEAQGHVTFEGNDLRAEAERGSFVGTLDSAGRVELFGDQRLKARLAQARTRVAANTIRTDLRGERLDAEGQVEATLLPQGSPRGAPARSQLFLAGQAIHFVSDRLQSEQTGQRLTFTGSVRGWQGERNLAAQRVLVDQRANTLEASGSVSTRIPREAGGPTTTEGDYVQIGADRLDYDDAAGRAVYTGQVRVRLVEGWLEAERVEVELSLDSREVKEIRASESVRIEFQRTSEGKMARPVSGTSDRLLYRPSDATVRLFGDQTPAAVRQLGEGGGTTTGRELHYRVDSGRLTVESGEQGPGRIRS